MVFEDLVVIMIDNNHNFFIRVQNSGNFVIVKGDIGKPKPQLRSLPCTSHVYGMRTPKDKETAKELMYTWLESPKARYLQGFKNFRKQNILNVKQKTSVSVQLTKIKKKICSSKSKNSSEFTSPERTFGQPMRPSTPMWAVMSNFYGDLATKQKHLDYKKEVLKIMTEKNKKKLLESENKDSGKKLFRRRSIV